MLSRITFLLDHNDLCHSQSKLFYSLTGEKANQKIKLLHMSPQEEDELKSYDEQDVIIVKVNRKRAQPLISQNENQIDMITKRFRMTPLNDIPEVVEGTSARTILPIKVNKEDEGQDSTDNNSDYFLADEEFERYPAGNDDTIFQDINDQDDDDDLLLPIPGGFWYKECSENTNKSVEDVKQRIALQDATTMTIEQPQKPQQFNRQIGTSTPHSDPEKSSESDSATVMRDAILSIGMSQPQAKVMHHQILFTKTQKDVDTGSTINKVELQKKVKDEVQEEVLNKVRKILQEKIQEKGLDKVQEKTRDKDINAIKCSLDQSVAVAPVEAGGVLTSLRDNGKSSLSSSLQPTSGQSVQVISPNSVKTKILNDETIYCKNRMERSMGERILNEFDKDIVKFKSFSRSIGEKYGSYTTSEKGSKFELGWRGKKDCMIPTGSKRDLRGLFPSNAKQMPFLYCDKSISLVHKTVAKVMEDNGSEVTKAGSDSYNHNMQDMKDFANLFSTNMNYRKYCESETSFGGIFNALLEDNSNYTESLEAVVKQYPSPTHKQFLSYHREVYSDVTLELWLMSWVLLMLKKGKKEFLQENENHSSTRMFIAVPHQFVQAFRLCHDIKVTTEAQKWSPIFYPLDKVDLPTLTEEEAVWITRDLVLQIISPSIYKTLGGLRPLPGKGFPEEHYTSQKSDKEKILTARPRRERKKVGRFQKLFENGFVTRKLKCDLKINLEILRSGGDKRQKLFPQIRINVWIHMAIFNVFVKCGCVPALLLKNVRHYFKTPSFIGDLVKDFLENDYPFLDFLTVCGEEVEEFVMRIRWILGEERMSILSSYLQDGLQWYQQNYNKQNLVQSLSIDSQGQTPSAGPSQTVIGKNTTSKQNTTPKQNDRIQTRSMTAKYLQ